MDRSKVYAEYIDQQAAIEAWLVTSISALASFESVSGNVNDLVNSFNIPLCVIFNDDIRFDDVDVKSTISISIKNKGSSSSSNNNLVKLVLGVVSDRSLSRLCRLASVISVENYIDSPNSSAAAIKNVITRIELEVDL